jgi:signal transduction histidine kinase
VARRTVAQLSKEIEGFRADRLAWDLDENLPETMADFRQCELVFHQVVRNSWEAIQGREDGEIVIRSRGKDCLIEFEISDNGEGMPETTQARAFEPFFTMREQASHLGLGLSLSRSIMELHRGNIGLESHPDTGTKAVLTWPAAVAEDLPQPEPELPEERDFRVGRKSLWWMMSGFAPIWWWMCLVRSMTWWFFMKPDMP